MLNTFIDKMVLGLHISFVDLSTRRNIEQTPPDLHTVKQGLQTMHLFCDWGRWRKHIFFLFQWYNSTSVAYPLGNSLAGVAPISSLTQFMFWTCKPVLRCCLSKGAFGSGKPQGVGISEWGGNGGGWKWGDQFTSNLGPGQTGSYHSKEGSK